MSERKEKWEIGYSKENYSIEPGESPFDAEPTKGIAGELLDGRFFIEKDLSENGADTGGIGLIYLARDMKLLGREVVVKILKQDASRNEDIFRKFLHEKEALIRVDHPNIVRILDSGEMSDGNPFMVMEYIPGHSLRRKMTEIGKLPMNVIANVVESVASAISAAHSKGIIHRDIKPENIMLTSQSGMEDRVRVIDFGIARLERSQLAPLTTISRGIGTVRYIAPEQLAGSLEPKPTADIYSLGIVAYEMLTGERPFKPESEVEMYVLQQQGVQIMPRALRPDLSPEAERLLLSSLEFEPTKRPSDIMVFGNQLANMLRLEPNVHSAEQIVPEPTILASIPDPDHLSKLDNESVVTPFKHVQVSGRASESPNNKVKRPLLLALIGLFAVLALAIPAGIVIWPRLKATNASQNVVEADQTGPITSNTNSNANTSVESPITGTPRELSYSLMIQKMRDGKPFGVPYKSSGQETLESGYKFKMYFEPDEDGYMYVFNEGKNSEGVTGFYLLFPTPSINSGTSKVSKGQKIETAQNTLGGGVGTEIMWVVWTKDKSDDVEAATRSAFEQSGAVESEKTVLLKKFLEKYRPAKPDASKDSANQRTIVKGNGDAVVHRFEIEHR